MSPARKPGRFNKALLEPANGHNVIQITSDSYILFAAANPKLEGTDFTALTMIDQQPSGFLSGQTAR